LTRRGTSCFPIAPVAPATNTLIINSGIEDSLHSISLEQHVGADEHPVDLPGRHRIPVVVKDLQLGAEGCLAGGGGSARRWVESAMHTQDTSVEPYGLYSTSPKWFMLPDSTAIWWSRRPPVGQRPG
jgi:hypothetical protein